MQPVSASEDDVARAFDTPRASSAAYGIRPGEPSWFSALRVSERHVGAIVGAIFLPLNWPLFWLFLASYCVRMWGTEAVYHRYFSHRAFRANRFVQAVLALIGLQTGQRGPLWWASKHREHHKFAETDKDPHSPTAHSFTRAYLTWFGRPEHAACNLDAIPDFARFPELRWLDRFYLIPFYGSALLLFLAGHYGLLGRAIGGLSALVWGFYAPCLLVIHATSLVNTLGHLPNVPGGFRRYDTRDGSSNRPLLAAFTLGAGWHNNHHRYAAPARAGFAWWEYDPTYYVLRLLQALRIVHGVKSALPADVRRDGGLRMPREAP
jgi:stearoyl-CoA desaturase (delta-9 desaturase)